MKKESNATVILGNYDSIKALNYAFKHAKNSNILTREHEEAYVKYMCKFETIKSTMSHQKRMKEPAFVEFVNEINLCILKAFSDVTVEDIEKLYNYLCMRGMEFTNLNKKVKYSIPTVLKLINKIYNETEDGRVKDAMANCGLELRNYYDGEI